ncbi:MAG: FecR domain-containing protein, partial [Pseudomonadales bacterium]|nr:FecR domain-containing protein [Pseudomonadales bacterium]
MSLSTPFDRNLPPESDHPTIFLPNASFLLYGEFERVGFDLVITNPAGEKFIVEDYFAFQPPPTLMIESGAGLTPEMVMALMPDQFAGTLYAGPATSGGVLEQIGTVRFASGDVEVTDRNGDIRTVGRGDPVYKGDRIETGDRSFIRIRMDDGTRFNLGKNAVATLDDFQYDEASKTGTFEAMVRVGGFHYKSGAIGNLNPNARHSTIKTPSAFIGIRGSELEGTVDNSGETIVVHRSGVLEIT